MHTYSTGGTKENIRRTIILWLFCISVIIYTLGNQLLESLSIKYPGLFNEINNFFAQWPWIDIAISGVSAFTVFGLLFWLFNDVLWKIGIVKKITGIPDFSGKWEGILKSSFDEINVFPISMVINQTWSKISVLCHFNESDSWSETAHINPEHGKGVMLKFSYANRARNVTWAIKEHRGDNELFSGDYDKTTKRFTTLKGDYYNSRGNSGNIGYIELKYKD